MAAAQKLVSPITRGIDPAVLNCGSPDNARTAAPTGSVAAPVSAITPFCPTSTPGVISPCTVSSIAITENPPPTTTVRASPARAPAVVSATAATVATMALTPTP